MLYEGDEVLMQCSPVPPDEILEGLERCRVQKVLLQRPQECCDRSIEPLHRSRWLAAAIELERSLAEQGLPEWLEPCIEGSQLLAPCMQGPIGGAGGRGRGESPNRLLKPVAYRACSRHARRHAGYTHLRCRGSGGSRGRAQRPPVDCRRGMASPCPPMMAPTRPAAPTAAPSGWSAEP